MRAIQLQEPGKAALAEVPPISGGVGTGGSPGDAPVLVRTTQFGLCGTDTKILDGHIPVKAPITLGHEAVGVVEHPGGSDFAVGQRVLIDPGVICGDCRLCKAGRSNLCLNGGLLGRDADGVFAELIAVHSHRLHAIPDAVSPNAAVLLQVLGTCVHALRRPAMTAQQRAVVIGLGVSGQLIVQLLIARGLEVLGVTRSEQKQELARKWGAAAVSPSEAAEAVNEHTDGMGADLVVEAVGIESTLGMSLELAATGGVVIAFGIITSGNTGLPYYNLYFKELDLLSPRGALGADYDEGIKLVAKGVVQTEPLITHRFSLDDATAAFEAVRQPGALKVVMSP